MKNVTSLMVTTVISEFAIDSKSTLKKSKVAPTKSIDGKF